MTTHHHLQYADTLSRMVALLDQFPAGCDPDFDDDSEELERRFAELRLNFPNH